MSLDHYITLGRSGLRVSPLCLGAMTFGEDLGWGSTVEESQQILDRYIALGGNFIDTANFYTKSHSEKIIGDHIGRHKAQARSPRHRDEVQRQSLSRRPERRRLGPQVDRQRVREFAPSLADRLHRPLLAPQLGREHADRRDDGRARRPSSAPARSATSVSPTRRPGRSPRRTSRRGSAAGRSSSACRSSIRSSSARSSRN